MSRSDPDSVLDHVWRLIMAPKIIKLSMLDGDDGGECPDFPEIFKRIDCTIRVF